MDKRVNMLLAYFFTHRHGSRKGKYIMDQKTDKSVISSSDLKGKSILMLLHGFNDASQCFRCPYISKHTDGPEVPS
jgi:hypothetical protein